MLGSHLIASGDLIHDFKDGNYRFITSKLCKGYNPSKTESGELAQWQIDSAIPIKDINISENFWENWGY